jgi:hypothetical protein
MARLLEVFLLPPLAIARVGGSDTPLEAFEWVSDHDPHGGHSTIIKPSTTLDVLPDGTLRPYVPRQIRFRDGDLLRPVAPFVELWGRVQRVSSDGSTTVTEEPINQSLLAELGATMGSIHFTVTMANRKAERRTTSQECGFTARVEMRGDDYRPKELLGFSPHTPGTIPLVARERPIPLGRVQVIQPLARKAMGVDLSAVRLRFTPPRGQVYGPPTAITAMASTVPPGPPQTRLVGRLHEIVKPENRILNEGTPWSTYVWNGPEQVDPQPSDSYDGAHDGTFVSWGVVDDTSDGVIEAQLVAGSQRFTAFSRLFSSCPDYAPDRRHFVSFADDLSDRDEPIVTVGGADLPAAEHEVGDLFCRVFETMSGINLDAARWFAINENLSAPSLPELPGWPHLDDRTMTGEDRPFADNIPDLLDADVISDTSLSVVHDRVPYTLAARAVHTPLTDLDTLLAFLQTDRERVERLLRPPFGRFWQLPEEPTPEPSLEFRDPRQLRDTMQDMRMPPYMRDSDENPLSLTWNQYRLVMDLVEHLHTSGAEDAMSVGPGRRNVEQLTTRLTDTETQEEPDA